MIRLVEAVLWETNEKSLQLSGLYYQSAAIVVFKDVIALTIVLSVFFWEVEAPLKNELI